MTEPTDRLDSWKAIAQYLGRDERTLRRWEKQGFPVRRVASASGHSVFAYKSEVDAWLRSSAPQEPAREPAPAPRRMPWIVRKRFAAVAVLVVIGTVSWTILAPHAADPAVKIELSITGIEGVDASGVSQWRFDFPSDQLTHLPTTSADPAVIAAGEPPLAYALTSYASRRVDRAHLGGSLYQLSLDGRLLRTFSLEDRWRFSDGRTYEGGWALTDFSINSRYGRRIAIAGHHLTWWPSVVTMLDDRWVRIGTFVNSGWVESLRWLSPDRVLIGGFNNGLDGGMLAVLDAHRMDGSSPENPAGPYVCETCPPGGPLFYAVFPRSELNRITGSGFNRAAVFIEGDRIIARTSELDRPTNVGPLSDAIYEFSMTMELLDAQYGDRYWDHHRRLELEGRVQHTRAQCPERDGPPVVDVWTREQGWRRITR